MTKYLSPEVRFWNFAVIGDPDACWEWRGHRDHEGYGRVKRREGGHLRAHRISFEIHRRKLNDGELVCHACDNPPCVNPRHLFAGTSADNQGDMARKGRAARLQGTKSPRAKLTDEQVIEIIRDSRRHRDIAADYGICGSHVSCIKTGKRWGHLHAN